MVLCYSGKSKPSAFAIAEASNGKITLNRGNRGDANWGRAKANTILNPDISNSTNKRAMREIFREHGVPVPELTTAVRGVFSHDDNGKLLKPLVGRPDKHMKGRGYWYCETVRDIERAIRGTRRKAAATHFMEYIEHDHEYRVHIFNGKSIRISEKAWDEDDEPMYRKSYTTIKPSGSMKYVRRAAKQAIKALGLDFGAVDVIVDKDGNPYVLEVNSSPGLGGSMPALWAKTFIKWKEEN